MVSEILSKRKRSTVRIHAAGDFFSRKYIRDWIRIVSACPDDDFYVYTRSWTDPKMLPVLVLLARLPNIQLWFSYDKSMDPPPRIKGIKVCYLSMDDSDVPSRKVDLVFRDNTDTVRKKMGRYNSQVCPYEIGLPIANLTCESCRLCFK
jgi:hypothetical protein